MTDGVQNNTDNATDPKELDAPKETDPKPEGEGEGKDVSLLDDGSSKSEDGKTDKDVGAPEKYEDFKYPEDMELDKSKLEQGMALFKELNLPQDKAQKLVDFYSSVVQEAQKAWEQSWNNTQKEWVDTTKADKEIGGDKLEANLEAARHVVKEYGTPALIEALNLTGIGNHVEVIRFLSKIGKMMKEDSVDGGGDNVQTERDVAKTLFPNQN